MRLAPLCFAVVAASPSIAHADLRLTCWAIGVTGFSYSYGQWHPTTFNARGRVYSLGEGDDGIVRFTQVGMNIGDVCQAPNQYGYVFCSLINSVRIDLATMRYVLTFPLGYVDGKDSVDAMTPLIEIGECALQ
jgi:hypothetical protein